MSKGHTQRELCAYWDGDSCNSQLGNDGKDCTCEPPMTDPVKHVAPGDTRCEKCGKTIGGHFGMRCVSGSDDSIWTYIEEQDMCKRAWISVKDRLPDDDGPWLLVYTKDYYTRIAGFMEGRWESYEGFDLDPEKTVYLEPKEEPTHWMPLPASPHATERTQCKAETALAHISNYAKEMENTRITRESILADQPIDAPIPLNQFDLMKPRMALLKEFRELTVPLGVLFEDYLVWKLLHAEAQLQATRRTALTLHDESVGLRRLILQPETYR
jgi:hypothetical protein